PDWGKQKNQFAWTSSSKAISNGRAILQKHQDGRIMDSSDRMMSERKNFQSPHRISVMDQYHLPAGSEVSGQPRYTG
ncbi:Hypothetical predicted protein, partial [Podarcis lilfordi]